MNVNFSYDFSPLNKLKKHIKYYRVVDNSTKIYVSLIVGRGQKLKVYKINENMCEKGRETTVATELVDRNFFVNYNYA